MALHELNVGLYTLTSMLHPSPWWMITELRVKLLNIKGTGERFEVGFRHYEGFGGVFIAS